MCQDKRPSLGFSTTFSFYDPERGHTAHKSFKPIGYVHELQAKEIDAPVSFYQEEVIKLNQAFQATKKAKKARQISDESPEKFLGYFPMKNINENTSGKVMYRIKYQAENI